MHTPPVNPSSGSQANPPISPLQAYTLADYYLNKMSTDVSGGDYQLFGIDAGMADSYLASIDISTLPENLQATAKALQQQFDQLAPEKLPPTDPLSFGQMMGTCLGYCNALVNGLGG